MAIQRLQYGTMLEASFIIIMCVFYNIGLLQDDNSSGSSGLTSIYFSHVLSLDLLRLGAARFNKNVEI